MALYIVTTWNVDAIVKRAQVARRTRPSAQLAYESAVYDALKAFGKLDTIAAHKATALAQSHNDIMPAGTQRSVTVSNTGLAVVLSRQA